MQVHFPRTADPESHSDLQQAKDVTSKYAKKCEHLFFSLHRAIPSTCTDRFLIS